MMIDTDQCQIWLDFVSFALFHSLAHFHLSFPVNDLYCHVRDKERERERENAIFVYAYTIFLFFWLICSRAGVIQICQSQFFSIIQRWPISTNMHAMDLLIECNRNLPLQVNQTINTAFACVVQTKKNKKNKMTLKT